MKTIQSEAIHNAWNMLNEQEAISFLQELVRINSVNPPGGEKFVAEAIESRMQAAGLVVELDEIAEGRTNLFVSLPANQNKRMENQPERILAFSGHLDTVPIGSVQWKHEPFGAELAENKLYGRGTSDMKGGVAAMLMALDCLHRSGVQLKGSLRFVGTVGEEVDCLGAKHVVAKGQIDDATAMIISEPSANELYCAHKGALWLTIDVFGKTAHGSMPEQGVNAIRVMNAFINKIEKLSLVYEPHPLLGGPSINIGTIEGGIKTNVVPDACTMTLDIRTVPGQVHQDILAQLHTILDALCKAAGASYQIEIANDLPSITTPEDDAFTILAVETAQKHLDSQLTPKGVRYYTDGSIYAPHLEIPVLIYGPGEPLMAHQPDEWIEVEKYLESIRYFIALAVEYLGA
ncbi:M20 family metallopeptidase [Aneurinibacillus sp. Ricciae_BoGa-3]|uniref:M20 family metallopeptidase n=1 Tax=Aneurinibacillus sp. Ricciae_BoGa-3 TaxID=3022697 RepID=UPI00234248C9|nr:M20 family metallopeptidase [Aneurinibacillus sp. Ricciae_BoGa-3]WCK55701.1 M20 family metallopeptidase [Aneurinibacillus sp. Ricciae_BoGa-3]